MLLHEQQKKIANDNSRFKVIRAGRKAGKTIYEREAIGFKATASVERPEMKYLSKKEFQTGRKVIYIAPTQDQARKIIWESLKTRFAGIGKPNEQMLTMRLPNEDGLETTIYVGGYENRENYRGFADVVHITFDEVDSLKDFFIAWTDIFRPLFIDTSGSADFIGTPQKENPNLKRLEKTERTEWATFHFTSKDNPYLAKEELDALEDEYRDNKDSYKQEILAEHIEDVGALFRYTSLVDMFSNTVEKQDQKFLIVDVADDGSDKTIFSFWQGLEAYRFEIFDRLNTDGIIGKIREYAAQERIPYSHVLVDAIGVGAGVASSYLLDGIVGFKSSYQAIKTDEDPVKLPNVHYTKYAPLTTEYKNLRSQCTFTLADLVNNHKIAVKTDDPKIKEKIIEELSLYQDVSKGDGKRMATQKEDLKELLGHSPDLSDTLIMRMYFHIREKMLPYTSEQAKRAYDAVEKQFSLNEARSKFNSAK